jgi:hypothetical protein
MDREFVKQLPTPIIDLLPYGAIKVISEETGIDRNNVRKILRGEWNNPDVIRRALELLEKQQSLIEELLAVA